MCIVRGDLNDIVALTKLTTFLVENNSILVEGLCLLNDSSFALEIFL